MTLNLASLNVRGLRDPSKCTRLLGKLKNLRVDVAAVQETHFTCSTDCRVLESDFNIFSAYGSRTSAGVSLLVGRSLDADVDVVFAGDRGWQVVANVAVKSFKFHLVAVYASNIAAERISFFRRLASFLDDTKQLVLMGDWNAILDPKIDKVGRGARRTGRCDSSHKLVRVSLRLANRSSLAGYWKFNTSLVEIRDFRDWLEFQIKRAFSGGGYRE